LVPPGRTAAGQQDAGEHDGAARNLQCGKRLGEQQPGEQRGDYRLQQQADDVKAAGSCARA